MSTYISENSSENIFYVYAYLRSKNSAIASRGTPYYIGKGSNDRAYRKHQGSIHLPSNKSNIVFLETGLSENKAFEIEKFLIAYHGRKDIGTGILLNRTNGGDGSSGVIRSPETRQKLSIAKKGENNPLYGKPVSSETRDRISLALRGKIFPVVECPHCGKMGKGNAMRQWHYNNCKIIRYTS